MTATRHPYWHLWTGVTGLLYARRKRHSPPVVLRALSPAGLDAQIRAWEDEHPAVILG